MSLMTELRKEIIEAQKIRTQVIGFKITFVSAGIGLIIANADKVPIQLLTIPAFVAIFFDFLISGYGVSIKRIGFYIRTQIEPILKKTSNWPETSLLWEEFMSKNEVREPFSLIGNIGITAGSVIIAFYILLNPFILTLSLSIAIVLILFIIADVGSTMLLRRMTEHGYLIKSKFLDLMGF